MCCVQESDDRYSLSTLNIAMQEYCSRFPERVAGMTTPERNKLVNVWFRSLTDFERNRLDEIRQERNRDLACSELIMDDERRKKAVEVSIKRIATELQFLEAQKVNALFIEWDTQQHRMLEAGNGSDLNDFYKS
jgi:hypothetical protein